MTKNVLWIIKLARSFSRNFPEIYATINLNPVGGGGGGGRAMGWGFDCDCYPWVGTFD